MGAFHLPESGNYFSFIKSVKDSSRTEGQAFLKFMMEQKVEFAGAYDRWTEEDIKREYKKSEKHLCLRPGEVKPEDVKSEVFRVLLGKVGEEDLEKCPIDSGYRFARSEKPSQNRPRR